MPNRDRTLARHAATDAGGRGAVRRRSSWAHRIVQQSGEQTLDSLVSLGTIETVKATAARNGGFRIFLEHRSVPRWLFVFGTETRSCIMSSQKKNPAKKELLSQTIEHIDITKLNVLPIVEPMQHMAYSSRDLFNAADIYDRMLRDKECGIILCLAGSLVSAGLKKIFVEMIRSNMVDAIVSTGANIV